MVIKNASKFSVSVKFIIINAEEKHSTKSFLFYKANHPISSPKTTKSEWYHGTLGRVGAVEILKRLSGNSDGSFLVRFSERTGLVLTMLYLEQDYHFPIQKEVSFF